MYCKGSKLCIKLRHGIKRPRRVSAYSDQKSLAYVLLCLLGQLVCLRGLVVELLGPGQRVLRLSLETLHLLLDGVHFGIIASVGLASSSSSAPSLVRILPEAVRYVI